MDIWKDCPQILIHKLFLTLLIGVGCLLVGIAYFCFTTTFSFWYSVPQFLSVH